MIKEQLDIVNEYDEVVSIIDRDDMHAKGLPKGTSIRVVNVFVVNKEGKILVPKRSSNRRIFPNCYDFSCGEHVMAGEDYDAAARRGLEEELGLKGPLKLLGKLSPRDGVSSFMKVYKIITDKKTFDYDLEGIASFEWMSLKELLAMIKKNPLTFKGDMPAVMFWYASLPKKIKK